MTIINPTRTQEEQEVLNCFFDDLDETCYTCQNLLIQLEANPCEWPLISQLTDNIKNTATNLEFVGLESLQPLLGSLRQMLVALSNQQIHFNTLISDLILMSLDLIKTTATKRVQTDVTSNDQLNLEKVAMAITAIATATGEQQDQATKNALLLIDPLMELNVPVEPTSGITDEISQQEMDILTACSITPSEDMLFFLRQGMAIESRSRYWAGRNLRMLNMVLTLNESFGCLIDPEQLAAAVFTHDIGMAYLPLKLLHKKGQFTPMEVNLLHSHPTTGYSLLKSLGQWDEAADIVLQHHEKIDGSGYPYGLSGNQIHIGARMLAIVDTFEACTHERAYRSLLKRPALRALFTLNRYAGTQFDQLLVDRFTAISKDLKLSTH